MSSPIIIISSTYKDRIIRPALVYLIKRAESWLLETNPRDEITIENFSNKALGACLRPYNTFLNLETYPKSCETPGGVP